MTAFYIVLYFSIQDRFLGRPKIHIVFQIVVQEYTNIQNLCALYKVDMFKLNVIFAVTKCNAWFLII